MMMQCVHKTSSVESYNDAMCAQNIISGIISGCDVDTEHHQWSHHITMPCVHKVPSVEKCKLELRLSDDFLCLMKITTFSLLFPSNNATIFG